MNGYNYNTKRSRGNPGKPPIEVSSVQINTKALDPLSRVGEFHQNGYPIANYKQDVLSIQPRELVFTDVDKVQRKRSQISNSVNVPIMEAFSSFNGLPRNANIQLLGVSTTPVDNSEAANNMSKVFVTTLVGVVQIRNTGPDVIHPGQYVMWDYPDYDPKNPVYNGDYVYPGKLVASIRVAPVCFQLKLPNFELIQSMCRTKKDTEFVPDSLKQLQKLETCQQELDNALKVALDNPEGDSVPVGTGLGAGFAVPATTSGRKGQEDSTVTPKKVAIDAIIQFWNHCPESQGKRLALNSQLVQRVGSRYEDATTTTVQVSEEPGPENVGAMFKKFFHTYAITVGGDISNWRNKVEKMIRRDGKRIIGQALSQSKPGDPLDIHLMKTV